MTDYKLGDYITLGLLGVGIGSCIGNSLYYTTLIATGFQKINEVDSLESLTNPFLIGSAVVGGLLGVIKANSD